MSAGTDLSVFVGVLHCSQIDGLETPGDQHHVEDEDD